MKRYNVRLQELSIREDAFDQTVRVIVRDAINETDAVGPALKKMFGASAFWQPDSGLGFWYGQVFKPCKPPYTGANSVTCRARIDVTELTKGGE